MTAGQRWSRGKPKEEGWHWLRYRGKVQVVRIYDEGSLYVHDFGWLHNLREDESEWCGPIESPHDQEAG